MVRKHDEREYMEYEAEIKKDPWGYAQTHTKNSGSTTLRGKKDPNDYHLFTPNSHYETKEVSSDEDVDEWLNEELKEEKGESFETLPCKQHSNEINPGGFTLPCTISNLKIYVMADVGAGINMMPKSLFEHLKLTNLKKTSRVVEMDDMTKKAPLGIVENIPVKIDSSIQKDEYFNPHGVENDDSPALEQRTLHYSEESINTVDSSNDSQEDEVGSHLSEDVVSRWHVCKRLYHVTFKVCEEDCGIWPTCNLDLSFCSGYDAIYRKEKKWDAQAMGNFERTRDNPYSRNFEVYKEEFDDEIKQLENKYELKAGRKRYALEEVWDKCEKFHVSTKLWYDKGFEEEELWQNGIEETDYTPLLVKTDAKGPSQKCLKYSQNGTMEHLSKNRSTENSDGLAAIQAQLNSLDIEIKKVNEKVYAAQVRCELCKGPHYLKDCPLKEEGKTLEEAYYTQFGAPFQSGGQYRAVGPGFYQRNNGNSSYPARRDTVEESV
ncbi:phospholipase-like protein [Tanacetum coccineum]